MLTTTPSRKDQKRREILDAATMCFTQKGFHGAGMAEICQAAGMSPGNLYRHFASKTEIVLAIVDEVSREHLRTFQRLVEEHEPLDAIFELVSVSVKLFCGPETSRLGAEVMATAAREPAVGATLNAWDQKMRALMRQTLTSLLEEHGGEVDFDVTGCADLILAFIDGAIIRSAAASDFDVQAAAAALKEAVRCLLQSSLPCLVPLTSHAL